MKSSSEREKRDKEQKNDRVKNKQDIDCKFYLRGQCSDGKKCLWKHDPKKIRRVSKSPVAPKNFNVGMQDQLHSLKMNQAKMMEELTKMIRKTGKI